MSRKRRREPEPKNYRVLLIILERHKNKFVCLCPAMSSMTEIHISHEGMPAGAIEYINSGNRFIHCETNMAAASAEDIFFRNWEWNTAFLDEANRANKEASADV